MVVMPSPPNAETIGPFEPKPLRLPAAVWVIWTVALLAVNGAYVGGMLWLKSHHASPVWIWPVTLLFMGVLIPLCLEPGRRMKRLDPHCAAASPAAARFVRRHLIAMTLYVFCWLAVLFAFRAWQPTGPAAYLLAMAPAVPLVADLAAMGLFLREETDEFQRQVSIEAVLWATGATLAIATIWGFLETFHLAPHALGWMAFPLWSVCLGPATILVRRRYA
jgi:hypothetical protein